MKRVLLCLMLFVVSNARAETFFPLMVQGDCLAPVAYTVGEQYVDMNNGVPDGTYSMLTRWQGEKSHQSFVNCEYGEININTWQIPHREVLGGGFNDMFGYSWRTENAPKAFGQDGQADLVVQAHDFYVSKFLQHLGTGPRGILPFLNVTFFAYLVDVRHPQLHPIAIVGLVQGTGNPSYPPVVATDYPNGVWYSTFPITADGPYNILSYTYPVEALSDGAWMSGPKRNFYRMMISSRNWVHTIRTINAIGCGVCPDNGYSEDTNDWRLKYAGIIAEVTLWDGMDGSVNNPLKDQLNTTIQWKTLGIYLRTSK